MTVSRIFLALLLSLACCAISCSKVSPDQEPATASVPDSPEPVSKPALPPASTAVAATPPALNPAGQRHPGATPTNRLAYTGYYNPGDTNGPRALIQDVVLRQGSFKTVGQEAFGYRVKEINKEWVLLAGAGAEFRLVLGENAERLPTVPGLDSSNHPPGFFPTSTGQVHRVPAPAPPESQVISPLQLQQLPANIQTQLLQRLQQKTNR